MQANIVNTSKLSRTSSYCTSRKTPLEAFNFMNSQFAKNVFLPIAKQVEAKVPGEYE